MGCNNSKNHIVKSKSLSGYKSIESEHSPQAMYYSDNSSVSCDSECSPAYTVARKGTKYI